MRPDFRLIAITGQDERLAPLNAEADGDGYRFVARLVDDWASGSNRFDQPGERLIAAVREGLLLGVCGLNHDPYTRQSGVGRLRHLYVCRSGRRSGIASALVRQLLEEARGIFTIVRLRTTPEAALFYDRLGFGRTEQENASHIWDLRTERP
jgi:GNAT superfamily N-acetyltransferase